MNIYDFTEKDVKAVAHKAYIERCTAIEDELNRDAPLITWTVFKPEFDDFDTFTDRQYTVRARLGEMFVEQYVDTDALRLYHPSALRYIREEAARKFAVVLAGLDKA